MMDGVKARRIVKVLSVIFLYFFRLLAHPGAFGSHSGYRCGIKAPVMSVAMF